MASATAVLLFELEPPIRVNCAEAAAFEKGDCVTFTGGTNNLTVAITSANNDIMGGIVADEKVANVGTSVAIYRRGIFKVEAGTSGCTVGKLQSIEAKNEFTEAAATDYENGIAWGRALESGTDGQFIALELFG